MKNTFRKRIDLESERMSQQQTSSTAQNGTHQNKPTTQQQQEFEKRRIEHQEQLKEKARTISHYLRTNKRSELESRSAKLRDERVEFFRAKDFYRFLRSDSQYVEKECRDQEESFKLFERTNREQMTGTIDDKILFIGSMLVHLGFVQRCERQFKEARKGRTKKVKYPHYLEKAKDQSFKKDGFYVWTYHEPMSWGFLIMSWAVAAFVLLACLFPLAPIWVKKIILYACMAFLSFFTVVIIIRIIVFVAVWLVSGRQFWILPNIASDEIPINEVFSPMWCFDDLDASGNVVGKFGLLQRILGTSILTVGGAFIYKIAPEKTVALKLMSRSHDAILEQFHLKKGMLEEGKNETKSLDGKDLQNLTAADTNVLLNETNNASKINSSADASVPFCELFPEDDECFDYKPKTNDEGGEEEKEEETTTTTTTSKHAEL